MKILMKQFIGFCLLLSIASTLVPANLFHTHDEHSHSHCDKSNASLESDPCHISIYHAQSLEHTCEHNSHATEAEEECEWCKYITSERTMYTISSNEEVNTLNTTIQYPSSHTPEWVWNIPIVRSGHQLPSILYLAHLGWLILFFETMLERIAVELNATCRT